MSGVVLAQLPGSLRPSFRARGTVLGTRGQRVRGEAEPGVPGAGRVAGLGRWQQGHSAAPSSRWQPKIPAETKAPHPGGAGAGPTPAWLLLHHCQSPPSSPCSIPSSSSGGCWGPPFSSGCLSGSQRVRGWGQDATVFPGARHCDGVSPPGAPPMSPNATAPGGGGRASVPRPSRGSLPPFRAGLSPAPVALPALGWGHWDTGGPEGLETRAPRQGQAWGVGPAQRDDVVGLSFGMLSPLAVPRFL